MPNKRALEKCTEPHWHSVMPSQKGNVWKNIGRYQTVLQEGSSFVTRRQDMHTAGYDIPLPKERRVNSIYIYIYINTINNINNSSHVSIGASPLAPSGIIFPHTVASDGVVMECGDTGVLQHQEGRQGNN